MRPHACRVTSYDDACILLRSDGLHPTISAVEGVTGVWMLQIRGWQAWLCAVSAGFVVGCGGPGADSAPSVPEGVVEAAAVDTVALSIEGMT